jgi:hypothetical protein
MAKVSLGAIGLIGTAFETCRKASQDCKLTESFGPDFRRARRKLESQTAILEELPKLKISSLVRFQIRKSGLSLSATAGCNSSRSLYALFFRSAANIELLWANDRPKMKSCKPQTRTLCSRFWMK